MAVKSTQPGGSCYARRAHEGQCGKDARAVLAFLGRRLRYGAALVRPRSGLGSDALSLIVAWIEGMVLVLLAQVLCLTDIDQSNVQLVL